MLKMQIIGHLGRDAFVNNNGLETCINFSIAHTDKYKENGALKEKTTWVSCSWWLDSQSAVIQYLKKGVQCWVEGFPEAKMWDGKDGKKACGLSIRVFSLQLLGGGSRTENNTQQPSQQAPATASAPLTDQGGYVPHDTGIGNDDDLPF